MIYQDLAKKFIINSHKFRRQKFQRTFDESMSGEIFAIFYILYQKEDVRPTKIAKEMEISSARVAAMLNSLEKKKLISRKRSDIDKRKINIELTKSGTDLAQKTKEDVLHQVSSMLEFLGEEDAKELVRIMSRLAKYMDT